MQHTSKVAIIVMYGDCLVILSALSQISESVVYVLSL